MRRSALPQPIGQDCALRVGDAWWVVDPIAGTLDTAPSRALSLPAGRWIGIGRDAAGRVLLAAADQTIHVVDPATGAERLRFAARVPPSRRFHFPECSPLLAGPGWVATYDPFRTSLAFYATTGEPLGRVRLDRALSLGLSPIVTVQSSGWFLGVGTWHRRLLTLRVKLAPGCS